MQPCPPPTASGDKTHALALCTAIGQIHTHQTIAPGQTGIASRMCGSILSQHHWGRFFQAELGEDVLDQLARMPPRDMRRSLMTAFGNARLARRDRLLGVDLPDRGPQRQRMGFVA